MASVQTQHDPPSQAESSKAVAIRVPNTPEAESRQTAAAMTGAQKQALIDNLQLEITERARKLRAQYVLHAQGLRSRLEMRINRIPQSLRSVNIEDLIEKYAEHLELPKQRNLPSTLSRTTTTTSQASTVVSSSPLRRGLKRNSSEMLGNSDKENQQDDLDLPKKRGKTVAATISAAPSKTGRAPSRKADASKVLSPKSHNSRTLPQSPFKTIQLSPGKSGLARPVSPIKPGIVAAATASLANVVAASEKPTRSTASSRTTGKQAAAGSVRGRGATAKAAAGSTSASIKSSGRTRASNSSQKSDSSAQTTIVRKQGVVRKAVNKVTGNSGKVAAKSANAKAAAKKEIPAPSAAGTGGRVLRTRR